MFVIFFIQKRSYLYVFWPYQNTTFVRFPTKNCVTSGMIEKASNHRDLNWIFTWFSSAIKAQSAQLCGKYVVAIHRNLAKSGFSNKSNPILKIQVNLLQN